jgi:ABC-2 type transport system permease protein
LLYFVAMIAASLAVSAWARSSRLALVTLLGFWIFNGLIAPRAVSDLAKTVYPTPSAFEFAHRMELALQDGAEKRAEALRAAVMKKYNVTRMDALPVGFQGISLQAGEDHGNEVFDHYYSQLWDTFERQDRVHQTASLVAPVLAVRSLSMALAGTDFAQHAQFARAAEDYRRLIQRTLNSDLMTRPATGDGPYLRGRDLWEKIPDFDYRAPGLGWVLGKQSLSLILLSAWTGGAIVLAWAATRRLRVD